MVWAEADTGHHSPGRWFPRYKQLTHRQWHSGGQACAGYPSVGSQEAGAGGWSSDPSHGNCCWQSCFVTALPACDVHIKMGVFGWGNGIVRLRARSDEGGSQPRVMH